MISSIKENIFLGQGNKTFVFSTYSDIKYTSVHNELLEITYKTGLIGASIYIYIYIASTKVLYKYRSYTIAQFLSIAMLGLLLMSISESYILDKILYLFVIFYDVKYILPLENEENRRK